MRNVYWGKNEGSWALEGSTEMIQTVLVLLPCLPRGPHLLARVENQDSGEAASLAKAYTQHSQTEAQFQLTPRPRGATTLVYITQLDGRKDKMMFLFGGQVGKLRPRVRQ